MEANLFNELNSINVNEFTEKKGGLTYLSWTYAWKEFQKKCPNAKYNIPLFDGKPYIYDEHLGYIVFTNITVGDDMRIMWLPVMDSNNKAMKDHPYKYMTKYGEKTCEAASMFDINKTLMRCLVKNIAMFGLGLYIYAGEDLPEEEAEDKKVVFDFDNINQETGEVIDKKVEPVDNKLIEEFNTVLSPTQISFVFDKYQVNDAASLPKEVIKAYVAQAKAQKAQQQEEPAFY